MGTKPETPTGHTGRRQEVGETESRRVGKVYIALKNHKVGYNRGEIVDVLLKGHV